MLRGSCFRPAQMVLVVVLLFGLGQCGPYQYDKFPAPSLNPPWLANPKIEALQETVVPPAFGNFRPYRVGLLQFHCPHHIPEVSYPVTRIFYRNLLERKLFQEVVQIPVTYYDLQHALKVTREAKVDLLLLGEVPYFLDGGTAGKTGVQVELKLVEAKSGYTLWYLSDTISATPRPIIDLWITETRPAPTPGIYTLVDSLADRMLAQLEQAAAAIQEQKQEQRVKWEVTAVKSGP